MYNTHVRAVRDLRNHYPEVSKIVKQHDQVIITKNGKSDAVLISYEDYKEYEDYMHMRYVDRKLAEAEAMAQSPDAKWHNEEEFWEKVKK